VDGFFEWKAINGQYVSLTHYAYRTAGASMVCPPCA
jgi:hypothetical protein